MEKNVKNQCQVGPIWYYSINQVNMKGCPSRKLFIIQIRGKYILIQQKMTKIGTFENKVQI
jgi:hypothetical protein